MNPIKFVLVVAALAGAGCERTPPPEPEPARVAPRLEAKQVEAKREAEVAAARPVAASEPAFAAEPSAAPSAPKPKTNVSKVSALGKKASRPSKKGSADFADF